MKTDLSISRTLEEAIVVLSTMKKSYTGAYYDAACASIAAVFSTPLSEVEKLVSLVSKA